MINKTRLLKGNVAGYIALSITCVVWGTTWVASKIGIEDMPALQMASIRQFIGGTCFVAFFMIYRKLKVPSLQEFYWLIIMALMMFVFANGLSTWSLKYIPTGLSSLVGALYPLSVVIIEMVVFKNRNLTILTFIGLLLGLTGIGIVFYENAFDNHPGGFLFGVTLSVTAMLSWSVGTLILTRTKTTINPYYSIGWQMLISSVLLYFFALATKQTIPIEEISSKAWGVIFYLVVMGSIISFVAFIYSMKKLPVAVASLYAYINPLVAIVVAAIVLKEKLTIHILYGAIVTLVGVFLVNYSIKRNQEKLVAEAEL